MQCKWKELNDLSTLLDPYSVIVHIEHNKVEVKTPMVNFFGITSNIKKTDMITKLICQLPDVDAFGRKFRLSFDLECVQDLGWIPDDWKFSFNPDHVKGVTNTAKMPPSRDLTLCN